MIRLWILCSFSFLIIRAQIRKFGGRGSGDRVMRLVLLGVIWNRENEKQLHQLPVLSLFVHMCLPEQ